MRYAAYRRTDEGRKTMDRKEFLKHAGFATGSLALMINACSCFAAEASDSQEASCEKRQEFTQAWAKTFFDLLDSNVDEPTRMELMHANGRACYQRGTKGRTIQPVSLEEFVLNLQKHFGKENCRRDGNTVYLGVSAPWLKAARRNFQRPIVNALSDMCWKCSALIQPKM
jgi:hypothetical protein